MNRLVKVAAIQARPQSQTLSDLWAGNDMEHALGLLRTACEEGADIACFPELYPAAGEAELCQAARDFAVYVIGGIVRQEGDAIYNTAVLIGPEGQVVGRQGKVMPTSVEMSRGICPALGYEVFETDLGNIGMIICADLPFSRRGIMELKRGGADIVFNPSWWFALGQAYPASVIGRHLEYGLPIFGVDIAKYALIDDRPGLQRMLFPPAGGYTTAAIPPPCRDLEELGQWFRTKPGGPNSMADFITSLDEDEGILYGTVDIEAARQFPGYFYSERAREVGTVELAQ